MVDILSCTVQIIISLLVFYEFETKKGDVFINISPLWFDWHDLSLQLINQPEMTRDSKIIVQNRKQSFKRKKTPYLILKI